MKTGEPGKTLIKESESIHDGNLKKIGLQPKLCPSGVWTVGWGHALFFNGKPLLVDDFDKIHLYFPQFENMTIDQADELFEEDLKIRENLVNASLKIRVNQNQFDALVSFVFNCGFSQTLFSLVNSRSPLDILGKWWTTHYITGNGVQMPGLVIRRRKEFNLYKS